MAQALVQLMIQDSSVALRKGMDAREEVALHDDSYFLDGPACRRVAIVDFDPVTGRPARAPARFLPDATNAENGAYDAEGLADDHPAVTSVNAFGTVVDTIAMVEENNGLGRRIAWAFDGDQLLVVPRAGDWANAFYERATRSLQFFSFSAGTRRVHTALSRDIVAHECGHAILDGIAPTLYDALTPESHGIHEAVADLIAVLMAVRSRRLRKTVLEQTNGSIESSTAFNSIAEDFGAARELKRDRPGALRDLNEMKTMEDADSTDPHDLSTVLSGALYASLVDVFNGYKVRYRKEGASADAAAEKALVIGGTLFFRRLLLRALDYLPPGDLTFFDFTRAMLAADRAAYPASNFPASGDGRERLARRMTDRGVGTSIDELLAGPPRAFSHVDADLAALRDSDWLAYRYVDDHRVELGIPAEVPITVHPRIDATKTLYKRKDRVKEQRELILKVGWDHTEPNGVKRLRASRRIVPAGVTLAIEWRRKRVLAVLRSEVANDRPRLTRDAMIRRLIDENALVVERAGTTVRANVQNAIAEIHDDCASLRGTNRLLHLGGKY